MANRKKQNQKPEPEVYEWVRANVNEGQLSWQYKLKGKPVGSMSHDEDVSEWTEKEIIHLTRQMLDVPEGMEIEVNYL